MIKVSVIVPVYNTEKYLVRCLNSLVNQTLREIEIIIVNDGSTDHSQNILDKYKKEYPQKVRVFSQKNAGQAAARNYALKEAKGEYVGFLDSDDYSDLKKYEVMYARAKREDASMVGCGYSDFTYRKGKEITLSEYKPKDEVIICNRELFTDAIVSPWLYLFKTSVVRSSGVYFPEGLIYEDTAFYINVIPYIDKAVIVNDSFGYRLRREASTTRITNKNKISQIFDVIEGMIHFYQLHGLMEEYKNELEYFSVRILLCSSVKRIAMIPKKNERDELTRKTFSFINKHFENYRQNPYFRTGKLSKYIKLVNQKNMKFIIQVFQMQHILKKYEE